MHELHVRTRMSVVDGRPYMGATGNTDFLDTVYKQPLEYSSPSAG